MKKFVKKLEMDENIMKIYQEDFIDSPNSWIEQQAILFHTICENILFLKKLK